MKTDTAPEPLFKQGQRVRIKREWCDSDSEAQMIFVCREDEELGRVDISLEGDKSYIVPRETVDVKMLEAVK